MFVQAIVLPFVIAVMAFSCAEHLQAGKYRFAALDITCIAFWVSILVHLIMP